MRKTLVAAGLLAVAACSSGPAPARGPERMGGGQTSADGAVRVLSVKLALEGRPNAQGATCEIAVANPMKSAVKRQCRVIYYSHTGAELLYPQETWAEFELAAGEHKVLEHTCPFRTAKEARLEIR
ncbi:MAG: hypothetical protein HYY17_14730 [Planctomycetes bacterium]|nr:hypothetical protein [Planctomycetota bacterium]